MMGSYKGKDKANKAAVRHNYIYIMILKMSGLGSKVTAGPALASTKGRLRRGQGRLGP